MTLVVHKFIHAVRIVSLYDYTRERVERSVSCESARNKFLYFIINEQTEVQIDIIGIHILTSNNLSGL